MNNKFRKWVTLYLKEGKRIIRLVECSRQGEPNLGCDPQSLQLYALGFNPHYHFVDDLREWVFYPYQRERIEMNIILPEGVTYDSFFEAVQRYEDGKLGEKNLGVTPVTSGFPITIRVERLETFWDRVLR